MYCQHCGTKIDDDALFCSNCGLRVRTASADREADLSLSTAKSETHAPQTAQSIAAANATKQNNTQALTGFILTMCGLGYCALAIFCMSWVLAESHLSALLSLNLLFSPSTAAIATGVVLSIIALTRVEQYHGNRKALSVLSIVFGGVYLAFALLFFFMLVTLI